MTKDDKEKAPVGEFLVVKELDAAVKFYKKAFGAQEEERYQDPRGKVWYAIVHIEGIPLQLMEPFRDMGLIAKAATGGDTSMVAFSHPDVNGTFQKAIRAGAKAIVEPQHSAFSGERFAQVRDPFGHRWWIKHGSHVLLEGALVVADIAKAVNFQKAVFGATEEERYLDPRDQIRQTSMQILGARLYLTEPFPETRLVARTRRLAEGDSSMLTVSLKDVDATFEKAIAHGGTAIIEPQDAYWGDRYAEFRAPFGVRLSCCGRVPIREEEIDPPELQKRFEDFLAEHDNPKSPAKVVGVKNV